MLLCEQLKKNYQINFFVVAGKLKYFLRNINIYLKRSGLVINRYLAKTTFLIKEPAYMQLLN
jgi:hypothetical protein